MQFCVDKQLAIAVLLNHEEHSKRRYDNDLRDVRNELSTLRQTPERPSPISLPAVDDLRPIRDAGGNGEYGDRRGLGATPKDPETWTFTNGKLVRNQAVYDADIATRELGFLKEAYGPPTLVNKLPRQNLFGAHWNDVMLTWHLAGGTTLYMLAASDNVVVTFLSREYKKIPAHEPNPYLSDKP
jgi:hypothetical protein